VKGRCNEWEILIYNSLAGLKKGISVSEYTIIQWCIGKLQKHGAKFILSFFKFNTNLVFNQIQKS